MLTKCAQNPTVMRGRNYLRFACLRVTTICLAFCPSSGLALVSSPGTSDSTPLNVKTYGARGDGHSDDTGPIQRILGAAFRRSVYFPSGTYIITRPVNLPAASLRIYGDGRDSVIREKSDNLGIFNLLPGSSGIEVDHLHFEETGTVHGHQLGRGALYINPGGKAPAVSNIFIHDNLFDCASTSCVAATYLINSRILRNTFDNAGTGEHGIYLSSDGNRYSQDVLVTDNIFQSSYHGKLGHGAIELAIQLRAAKRITIAHNRIAGWSDGILTIPEIKGIGSEPGVSDLVIRDNTIASPADDGFVNFGGTLSRAIVDGNIFTLCGENGIRSDSPLVQSIFQRNRIVDSGEAGIRLNFVSHSTFAVNSIDNSGRLRRDGTDSMSAIRLNQGNTDNLFLENASAISSTSRTGPQTSGLSVANGVSSAPNARNCFQADRLLPNSSAAISNAGVTSDCTEMLMPIKVEVMPAKSSGTGGLQRLSITNRNRVPLRILGFKAGEAFEAGKKECGDVLEAHGQCTISLARVTEHRGKSGELGILYQVSDRTQTASISLP